MRKPAIADISINWFRPGWRHGLFAGALAAGAFLLPQEAALEWYPLNDPGTDAHLLEISCAANVSGQVEIRYDLAGQGHRPVDTISWPISPTARTYTYTFPLPDAPIVEMRVISPAGGELTIRQMRVINRRHEEVRRFTPDLFRTERDTVAITPVSAGWKIVSAPGGAAPSARIELFSPIIPVGKDHRNLLRCLLSTGYLTLMLWILLLAVLFVFYRPARGPDLLAHLGFMAVIALLFALVGNRGLIRNSLHYARYSPPVIAPGLRLEFDVVSSGPSPAQLFWDIGRGINGDDSARLEHEPHPGQQTLRFALPAQPLKALRFDPRDNPGSVLVRGIRLVDAGQRTRAVLPLDSLRPERDIATMKRDGDDLIIQTVPEGGDAITSFTAPALEMINRALARPAPP